MIEKLRAFQADRMDADELIELFSFGKMVATTYRDFGVGVPVWIEESMSTLGTEIKSRHRDMLQARLKAAKSRRDALLSREEKRGKLDDEIKALEAQLGS